MNIASSVRHLLPDSSAEMDSLRARLREAEETLDAIRYGRVDALVISKNDEEKIFTLQGAEHTYRMMVEAMNEGVITLASDGTILYCNRCFSDMLKIPLDKIAGNLLQKYVAPSNIAIVEKMLQGIETEKAEIWLLDADGKDLPVFLSPQILQIKDEPTVIYMVAMDLTSHKQYEARLEYQANYDALTGLANRNRLHDRLKQAIVSAERYKHQVTVAFIDVDLFKFINDSLGHHVGDELLKAVAARLKSCMRENDTVARHGGDEFVVVIDHSDEAVISLLMSRILASVAEPIMIEERELQVTCSIGFSLYPIDGLDADTLLKNADAAMYRAKEQGRNNVQFYTEELNQKIRKRLSMESMLRHALERDEFFLQYQPQVSLQTGAIVGVEALIRWNHASEGIISPVDFIPLAEELGLIVPIGEWVLRTACAQMQAWHQAGFPKISIAVNLSARQFKQHDLAEVIARILHETGLDPAYLDLELTESMVMHNVESAVATLNKLKHMGIKLSIDDFGTGYSSLNYLKRFPIDFLKIDKSFVKDITSEPDDAAIACSIIALAHSLRLKVIAEGVETEGQLAYLASHSCDAIQGYYFSRPMSPAACEQFFSQDKQLTISLEKKSTLRKTMLIVDDEVNMVSSLRRLFRPDHYHILAASTASAAFELLALHDVQVVISDNRMTGMTGTEFLSKVRDLYPDTIRIMLSGYTNLDSIITAINCGAIYRFFTKPWDDVILRKDIREAFEHHGLLHETKSCK
ncbi:MAG: EAL domain-containing protein [Pseudomonadota bacterium]